MSEDGDEVVEHDVHLGAGFGRDLVDRVVVESVAGCGREALLEFVRGVTREAEEPISGRSGAVGEELRDLADDFGMFVH